MDKEPLPVFFEAKALDKKISLNALPPEAWEYIVGGSSSGVDLWRRVPFMRRGVDAVAWGITQIPFRFSRKGKVVTDGSDYKDPTKGLLPNPRKNFSLIASSLLLYNRAYQHIEKDAITTRYPLGLKWMQAKSVTPVIEQEGLVRFKRRVRGEEIDLEPDEVLHFWPYDPDVEIGPPLSSAADAALLAAGAARSVDEFITAFFDRGALKATVFTAKNILPGDQEKIKTWLDRLFSGLRGAFRPKVFNAENITPVVIGEGLENMENQSLSDRLRNDIATALGVPQSILFSSAANFSVSEQDYKSLFTLTIGPMADVISDAYNQQLLEPMGLQLEFDLESMDIFQEEEADRSGALVNILNAVSKAPPKVVTTVMQMVGMELPNEMDYTEFEKILAEGQAVAQPPPAQALPETQPVKAVEPETKPAFYDDLAKWERKALNHLKAGKRAKMLEFESDLIPASISRVIMNGLQNAETAQDVKATFELVNGRAETTAVLQFRQALEAMMVST